eukprot:gene9483-biopygen13775
MVVPRTSRGPTPPPPLLKDILTLARLEIPFFSFPFSFPFYCLVVPPWPGGPGLLACGPPACPLGHPTKTSFHCVHPGAVSIQSIAVRRGRRLPSYRAFVTRVARSSKNVVDPEHRGIVQRPHGWDVCTFRVPSLRPHEPRARARGAAAAALWDMPIMFCRLPRAQCRKGCTPSSNAPLFA